ncbi:Tether containing UBX domain for GLUT4 [Mortierella alpina]|uniref:Tether containing UBX domain for GLUT4 n=1 Tax=Mortierella alpina TaxID=64518 RepID=A0A9P6M3W0_MORAP|nr:Tether containing UBX domain for GLUT4 [Mortierella alpina]
MASNLTVNLGGGKKQLVKTTPNMILRQVVNTVCEKQSYPEPESYGLKSGKNFLDLSLSIRYANIAPGAKLELARVPKDKKAPTHVDLALQLEDGGRVIQSFAVTTSLWDVLLGFEKASNGPVVLIPRDFTSRSSSPYLIFHTTFSIGITLGNPCYATNICRSLNLTRRTAVPQSTASKNIFSLQRIRKSIKPASEVYLLPVVILLEREYVSIQTLKTTSLQLAGLHKGNAVFRVLMRYTDAGIEEFMEDIERTYTQPAAANNGASPAESSVPSSVMAAPASPVRKSTTSNPASPKRQFTTDKTASDKSGMDFTQNTETYTGGSPSNVVIKADDAQEPLPGMTSRSGSIENTDRRGHLVAPSPGASADIQRQTPVQDMNSAMIEANQEIRQLREQQTQAALTDRVKRLSKASDSSDRERFVRSLPPGAFTDEPDSEMDVDASHTPRSESPFAATGSQDDVVRQIAHRVSQQLRQVQQRGGSMDYHSLIAQEIEKEQRAGVLPSTPTGSRHNSVYKSKVEEDGSPRQPGSPPASSRSTTMPVTEESFDRQVKVFRPPSDTDTPLSNQIDLPDDFYTLSSQDVMRLMNSQKAKREEEENRGFKTAATRAEEEKARERRYPKTIIRVRFPDRVQLQATFKSQETVGDLRKWVKSACVGQGEAFELCKFVLMK